MFYQVKVEFTALNDKGENMKMKESYLVEAISFSEAETKVLNLKAPFHEDVRARAIKETSYSEIVSGEGDLWHSIKVCITVFDEKAGKDKKSTILFLVEAKDIKDAQSRMDDHLRDSVADYQQVSVSETDVVEVLY